LFNVDAVHYIRVTPTKELEMTPIATAVAPLKQQAERLATERAQARIDATLAELAAAGWDAEVYAPYPSSTRMDRERYIQARAKYNFVRGITSSTLTFCRHMGAPDPRVSNPEAQARFVAQCVEAAGASYDAFVAKLERKVGDHSAARMLESGTWSYSVVEVTTPNGIERWKTQMIINVSVLGNVFNQWPTRKVK
jgi:hypothetical protein